jgi:TonB family protein
MVLLTIPALLVCGNNEDKQIQEQLNKKFLNQFMIIRNFYPGNILSYSSDGKILSGGISGIWTLHGYFQPNKITLSKEKISLYGRRLYWTYNYLAEQPRLVPYPETTTIKIAKTPEFKDYLSIISLLNKVFLASNEKLEDIVPSYWKSIIHSDFKVRRIWGTALYDIYEDITQPNVFQEPRALERARPSYSEEARNLRVSGFGRINMLIDEQGNAKAYEIIQPIGAGLDENIIRTFEAMKYIPATYKGQPVKVLTIVECSFSLLH